MAAWFMWAGKILKLRSAAIESSCLKSKERFLISVNSGKSLWCR